MMKRICPQRGGTLLGLIVGLVIGLGLALAVAVYVTKVPVPFVNKGNTRNVEQDAVEAKKNKDWDPNGMIQGKAPMRSATGAVTDSSTEKDPATVRPPVPAPLKSEPQTDANQETKPVAKVLPKPESKPEVRSDTKPEPKKEPAPSADPLGDLAKAKSAGSTVDPFTYMVQTGAFKGAEEAEAHRVRLMLSGVDAKVTEREQSGRTVFRVRSGPYERRDDAEKMKDKLETAGFDAVLVRIQR
jgi:cell division protein FtsN